MNDQSKTKAELLEEIASLKQRIQELEQAESERRRAEEQLKQQTDAMEAAIDGIAILNAKGEYVYLNKAHANIYGYDNAGELIGKSWSILYHSDELQRFDHEIMPDFRQKGHWQNEAIGKKADGRRFPQELSLTALDSGGMICVVRDITERKRMEEELEREQAQLFLIFDQMPVEVSVLDTHTYKILFMNRYAREIYGQDSMGRFCYGVFHGRKAPCRACNNEFLLGKNDDESIQGEFFSERVGRHYFTTNSLIRWPGGRRVKLEISIDITERNRAEQEKAILAEIGRLIGSTLEIEEVYEPVAAEIRKLIPFDSLVVNLNNAQRGTLDVTYVSGLDIPGRRVGDSYPVRGTLSEEVIPTRRGMIRQSENPENLIEKFPSLIVSARAGMHSVMSVPLISRDEAIGTLILRSQKPGAYSKENLRLAEQIGMQIAGAIANAHLFNDLNKTQKSLRESEEHLQRAEKMEALGQLAGGVAHDLNNVLGILTGYSELLLEESPEGSRSRMYVDKILQSTEKGAAIIQDLLTLARRGVTASEVINLNGVVSGFLKTPVFEKMKDYHPRVTFRTECDKSLLNIKGSPVHLEKTLMNLVSNAAESISGKGEVTIRTESRCLDKPIRGYDEVKEGDYAVLTVSDTGKGIPAENREKIFEPFYTKKTMGRSGTGLGLAIVWGTVKDHNGYIDLQTEVGEGSTFTLYFPVTREELILPQQKEPIERYMGKGESVLVVDDIAEQRDVAARLLTRLGYTVHWVSSGEEAVEYLKGNKADILVLDMIMPPGIDGLETYQRVLQINPKQKAILVSGFSETDRVREAQKLGAGAYVKKPYVLERIGVAVRDELSR